jgi:hypothetical protein
MGKKPVVESFDVMGHVNGAREWRKFWKILALDGDASGSKGDRRGLPALVCSA